MEEDLSHAIYGTLGDFEFNEKLQEECHKIEDLTNQLNKTTLTISNLQNEVKDLRKSHRELEKHFSTILKTARLEIQRKDQHISQLQQKIDNTVDPVFSNNRSYEQISNQSQHNDLSRFHVPKQTNSWVQHENENERQNDITICNVIGNAYEHVDPNETPQAQHLNDGERQVVQDFEIPSLVKEEIELSDQRIPVTSTQSQKFDAEFRFRDAFVCVHREVMENPTLGIEYKKDVLSAARDYVHQWDCQLKCEDPIPSQSTVPPIDHTSYHTERIDVDIHDDRNVATGFDTKKNTKPKCPICNFVLCNAKPSTLASHMGVHESQNQCQRCLKPMKKSSIPRHLPTCPGIPTKRRTCNQCKKTFSRMRTLKQHIKTKHPVV